MVLVHFSGEEVDMASDSPARSLDEIDLSALRVSETGFLIFPGDLGQGERARCVNRGWGWWGRGGQIRDGGNLESRLDLGAAAVLSAESPRQGLCGTWLWSRTPWKRGELVPVSSRSGVSAFE